jgi:ABC-type multidrug transport system fused ATPase/permease subunit
MDIKISFYDLITKLFVGALFTLFTLWYFPNIFNEIKTFEELPELILNCFWISYLYFIGYLINRIGSLCLEILCEKTKIIKKDNYYKYNELAKTNPKLNILSMEYALSRTLATMFIIILIITICIKIYLIYTIYCVIIILVFIFSMKKHSEKINKIINKKENDDKNYVSKC